MHCGKCGAPGMTSLCARCANPAPVVPGRVVIPGGTAASALLAAGLPVVGVVEPVLRSERPTPVMGTPLVTAEDAEYRKTRELLIELWSKAVGHDGYVRAEWTKLSEGIDRLAKAAKLRQWEDLLGLPDDPQTEAAELPALPEPEPTLVEPEPMPIAPAAAVPERQPEAEPARPLAAAEPTPPVTAAPSRPPAPAVATRSETAVPARQPAPAVASRPPRKDAGKEPKPGKGRHASVVDAAIIEAEKLAQSSKERK